MSADGVPVTEQIARVPVEGERFDDLLGRPRRCGMSRHVEVDDPPTFVPEHRELRAQGSVLCGQLCPAENECAKSPQIPTVMPISPPDPVIRGHSQSAPAVQRAIAQVVVRLELPSL